MAPLLVHKTHDNARTVDDGQLLSDDEKLLIDVVGDALGETRVDMRAMIEAETAPLRERIAALDGKIETLLAVFGVHSSRAKSPKGVTG
jgi:hypothetical protein